MGERRQQRDEHNGHEGARIQHAATKNFYMDNLLQSLNLEEEVTGLVNGLWHLLKRVGFKVIK